MIEREIQVYLGGRREKGGRREEGREEVRGQETLLTEANVL